MAEMDAVTYCWQPGPEYLQHSNIVRLLATFGVDTADDLRRKSVEDIASFWDGVVADLGIPFRVPYTQVLDVSGGIEWATWFVDGRLNAAEACLGRWATQTPDAIAVIHEDEGGRVRRSTFRDVEDQVAHVRGALRRAGVRKGDAVAIYLPMITEAVIATYAVASIGAVLVPLFSGFAPGAIASRLQDAEVVAVITADATVRRGRRIAMLQPLREALTQCPSIRTTLVVGNVERNPDLQANEIAWSEAMAVDADADVEDTSAEDVLLLAYTSGTTGRPKGAVHTHAGFVTKTASEVAYGFDIGPGRVFSWITDMGWIMGPLSIFGTHANGGTLCMYEGSPDTPDAQRLWQMVQKHSVSMLGVSPTLIRALRASGAVPDSDLSALRVIGSTGEPWDPDSYEWLARDVLGERVPIINFSGGTEVGGSFLSPYPIEEIRSCSLGGPALGMDVDVVDDAGNSVRGVIGELVCRQPWPAMTRGVWRDPERYHEAYWSTFPGLWRHGDHALVDGDRAWFILGRSDDVMNVAGKRVAPAEIESVVSADPDVVESAVVGIPDPLKGESVWVFYIAKPGSATAEDVAARVRRAVAEQVGKPFTPSEVVRVDELPKTRSAKILRRAIRAAVTGSEVGDLSGAENPGAVQGIAAAARGSRT